MEYDVFVSHSSEDRDLIEKLVANIEAQGIKCWVAPRNIEPGTRWAAAINQGMKNSCVMLVVISQKSNTSLPVENEVERFFNQRKIIIPYFKEEVKLSDSLDYFLSSNHFFIGYNKDFETIVEELGKHLKNIIPVHKECASSTTEPTENAMDAQAIKEGAIPDKEFEKPSPQTEIKAENKTATINKQPQTASKTEETHTPKKTSVQSAKKVGKTILMTLGAFAALFILLMVFIDTEDEPTENYEIAYEKGAEQIVQEQAIQEQTQITEDVQATNEEEYESQIYEVKNRWDLNSEEWHNGGLWLMGVSNKHKIQHLSITSTDEGKTLSGEGSVFGLGKIEVSASLSSENDYNVDIYVVQNDLQLEGVWTIGCREKQKVVMLRIESPDKGMTLNGEMQYSNEGPIKFNATISEDENYL